jgi:hypothetical protein
MYTWMCTLLPSFTISLPLPPHWFHTTQTRPVSPSCSLILYEKRRRKKMPFLVNKATQGVSLWHFHVYMYYSPIWFISSVFLISILVPFLWWFQLVWKLYIHFCTESTSIIFTFLTSFFYPPPSDVTSLSVTCFSVLPIFHIWETACNFWPCAPG